jgi:hypothetical protein
MASPTAPRRGRARGLVPAELETSGALQGLAENQAGSVVEGFKRLGVELVDAVLASGLGCAGFNRPSS